MIEGITESIIFFSCFRTLHFSDVDWERSKIIMAVQYKGLLLINNLELSKLLTHTIDSRCYFSLLKHSKYVFYRQQYSCITSQVFERCSLSRYLHSVEFWDYHPPRV